MDQSEQVIQLVTKLDYDSKNVLQGIIVKTKQLQDELAKRNNDQTTMVMIADGRSSSNSISSRSNHG